MSQRTIPSNDESLTVAVGYDRPLDWFFGTVYNATAPTVENEDVVADLGRPRVSKSCARFARPMRRLATICCASVQTSASTGRHIRYTSTSITGSKPTAAVNSPRRCRWPHPPLLSGALTVN